MCTSLWRKSRNFSILFTVVAMKHDRRVELIDLAVQKLIQDNRNKESYHCDSECNIDFLQSSDDDAEYQLALSQLLSASQSQQLEMLKRDDLLKQSKASSPSDQAASVVQKTESKNVDGRCSGSETDEIVKELKKVKRQNFVTHCLLSVMIVLTVAWQLSEVSFIMKVKDGINHPFRSFGNMLKGVVKVPDMNGQEADNKDKGPESPSLPSLIPEMPQMDVPNLGLHNGKQ